MTSPSEVAGATQQAAGQTAGAAKDGAAQVASTATSAAADVAGTAREQVGAVAGQAVGQARDLLDQTRTQLTEQAGGAQQKLGESLRALSDELHTMGHSSTDGGGPAHDLVRSAATRGHALADYLGDKQPGDLVQDLRQLAARRPGGFLLGALVAGIAAGRLVRGAAAASHDETAAAPEAGYPSAPPYPSTPPPAYAPAPPYPPTPAYDAPAVPPLGVPGSGL